VNMNIQEKAKNILLRKRGFMELSNQQKDNLITALAKNSISLFLSTLGLNIY
jgi:hypothetical protein